MGKGNEFQGNRLSGLVIRTNGPATLTNLYAINNGWNTYESLGDFTIKTYLSFEPDSDYQLSGLVVYQDKGNFLEFGRAYCDAVDCAGNGIYFDSVVDTIRVGSNFATVIASPSVVYLKLERSGSTLNGYYSADGSTWTFLGSHALAPGFQINGFGLTASQDLYNPTPQISSDFDFFGIENLSWIDGFNGYLEDGWVWVNENPEYWNLTENPSYLRIYNNNGQTGSQNMLLRTVGDGYGVDIDALGAVNIKQLGQWGVQNGWAEGNVFSRNSMTGLKIISKGAVTVGFFQARENGGAGVYIDNTQGTGAVSLTGTSNYWGNLNNNQSSGLIFLSKGNITVSKVDGSNNWDVGGYLDNCLFDDILMKCLGVGSVTLTDAYLNYNWNTGLDITSAGTITWKNGETFANGGYGASRVNNLATGKTVTVTNVQASWNLQAGLYILSKGGAVTITDTQTDTNSTNYNTISENQWWRDNLGGDDQVWYFDASKTETINIEVTSYRFTPSLYVTGPNGFYSDVYAVNTDGTVSTLSFTLPDDENYAGTFELHISPEYADCWNCWGYDLKLDKGSPPSTWIPIIDEANGIFVDNTGGSGAVTITNASNRWNSNNSGTDVKVLSGGVVTLRNMDLNDSGEGGLEIDNSSAIGAVGVNLTNVNFNNIDRDAAKIRTKGAVTVTNSGQGGNWGYGFEIDNTPGTAISPITMTNVNLNNWGSFETGFHLRSDGAITLTNVSSNGNGNQGFDIITPGAVKFTNGWANGNFSDGISIEAGGAISLTNISTNDNGRDPDTGTPINDANGIYLVSTNTLGTAPISLTGVTANHNTLNGVNIDTNGAVTINTLTTNNNADWGLYLDQTGAPDSLKAIALNLLNANGNGLDGVNVQSKGNITVNTFFTTGNDNGLLLDNRSGTGSVTLLSTLGIKVNVSAANRMGGVAIYSKGAVSVSQLESIGNSQDGLDVDNSTTALLKPAVNLSNVLSRFNLQTGMYVKSSGITTISNSWSVSNSWDGIKVEVNNNVNILNTASINNGYSGIWAKNTTGPWKLTLTGSAWFGNLRDAGSPRTKNLYLDPIVGWNPIVY